MVAVVEMMVDMVIVGMATEDGAAEEAVGTGGEEVATGEEGEAVSEDGAVVGGGELKTSDISEFLLNDERGVGGLHENPWEENNTFHGQLRVA